MFLSFLLYAFLVLLCTSFLVISALTLVICRPFDAARRVVHEQSRFMVRAFFGLPPKWTRQIEGLENINPNERYVIVMNHNSMLDIPVAYLLPLNFRWVSKREVFYIPFFGQFLLLHGDIAIKRGSGTAAMAQVIRDGKKWIGRGASIAIFPEGTRSKTGDIGRFKAGAFNLAHEAQVKILPVVMDGTREMIGEKKCFNWQSQLKVRVLPPVSLDDAEGLKPVMDKVREDMIVALNELKK